MSVTTGFSVIAVLFAVVFLNGCGAAPKPCPQFLPVAVKLDQPYQRSGPYNLKALVKVANDNEHQSSKREESNLVVSPNDLTIKPEDVFKASSNPEEPKQVIESRIKQLSENVVEKTVKNKLPQLLELSTLKPEVKTSYISDLQPKKRRRSRPKESKKIILNQNSIWALRTINDKPAEEVLRTDKASVARDLKDSTESALVTVKQLDQQI